jgi:hypothetical protein
MDSQLDMQRWLHWHFMATSIIPFYSFVCYNRVNLVKSINKKMNRKHIFIIYLLYNKYK